MTDFYRKERRLQHPPKIKLHIRSKDGKVIGLDESKREREIEYSKLPRNGKRGVL